MANQGKWHVTAAFLLLLFGVALSANWTLDGNRVYWQNNGYLISCSPANQSNSYGHFEPICDFNGTNPTSLKANFSFVFPTHIQSGKVLLEQNLSRQITVPIQGRVNYTTNVLVASSVSTPNATRCDVGDLQNPLKYNVTIAGNGTTKIYCFVSTTNVSNNYTVNYQLDGTVGFSQQTVWNNEWTDISSLFTRYQLANYDIFTINNAQFPNNYRVKFVFNVPQGQSGKFDIYAHQGSPAQVIAHAAPILVQLDPWYDSGTINLPANTSYYLAYQFSRNDLLNLSINPVVNITLYLNDSSYGSLLNSTTGANVKFLRNNDVSDVRLFDVDSIVGNAITYWVRVGNTSYESNVTMYGDVNITVAILNNKTINNENEGGTWQSRNAVAVYHFNENGTLVDSAGYRNLPRNNANCVAEPHSNFGYGFSGNQTTAGCYWNETSNSALPTARNNYTVMGWWLPLSGNGGWQWGGSTSNTWSNGRVYTNTNFTFSTNNDWTTSFPETAGTGFHIAAMEREGFKKWGWQNGGANRTDANGSGQDIGSNLQFQVGGSSQVSGATYVGLIDEFRVYNDTDNTINDNFVKFEYGRNVTLLASGGATSPPVIASINLLPATPYYNDTLNCSFTGVDNDSTLLNYTFTWYKNVALNSSGTLTNKANNTQQNVTISPPLIVGDTWFCNATVTDGSSTSSPVASATRTVANTLPTIVNITVFPSLPSVNSTLSCLVTFTNPDQATANVSFEWYRNGTNITALANVVEVAAGTNVNVSAIALGFNASDRWACAANVNDGINVSGWSISANVTIVSAATQTCTAITVTPAIANASANATVNTTPIESYVFVWTKMNGEVVQNSTATTYAIPLNYSSTRLYVRAYHVSNNTYAGCEAYALVSSSSEVSVANNLFANNIIDWFNIFKDIILGILTIGLAFGITAKIGHTCLLSCIMWIGIFLLWGNPVFAFGAVVLLLVGLVLTYANI